MCVAIVDPGIFIEISEPTVRTEVIGMLLSMYGPAEFSEEVESHSRIS